MDSKYPIEPPKDIIRILEKSGFKYVSKKASHMKYSNGLRNK